MDEENIHPCDVRLDDVITWHGAEYKVMRVIYVAPNETIVTWRRIHDGHITGPMTYERKTTGTLQLISRGTHIIEEDLTPADVG
jgi:hypothetical protein